MDLGTRVKSAWNVFRGKSSPNLLEDFGWTIYPGFSGSGYDRNSLLAQYTSWVYACVNIRAKTVAQATFRVYRKLGPDEFEEIDGHPLTEFLSDPNPFLTKFDLLYSLVTHLDLVGDGYFNIAFDGMKIPRELWLLPPNRMKIIPHATNFISRYEYLNGHNETIPFNIEEIIHFRYPKPDDPYYGWSPLSAAATFHSIDVSQADYAANLFKNGAIPPIALTTDKPLGDSSRKALAEAWQQKFGGAANQGRTPVLDNGLKITPVGVNPKDLDWLAANRVTRDKIMGIYGVPASKLGLVEDVNRASAIANDYTFAVNVVEPILNYFDGVLSKAFSPLFAGEGERLVVKHDSTVPKDISERANAMKLRLDVGMTTRNEERLAEGFEAIEGGDQILVPLNYTTLDKIGQEPTVQPQGDAQGVAP